MTDRKSSGTRGGQRGGGRPRARRSEPAPTRDVHDPNGVRLQKVLAAAGLGSRRACEEIITDGRVSVDGVVVRELGVRIDPHTATVHVDGLRVQLDTSLITLALNKPRGVVSTMYDPEGRPSLAEYVANRPERLFHVGRLDIETEGLILLTNDGELANRLAHPSHGVPKTYVATVAGTVPRSLGRELKAGIELEDGPVTVDDFRILDSTPRTSMIEVVLHEGRNHIVRRLFEEVGLPVTALARTRIGPVAIGSLKPGRTRVLGREELGRLMTAAGL